LHWAEYMEMVILSWFILEKTNSPLILGVYGALRFTATLFAPLIGVVVDRLGKRLLIILVRTSFLFNSSIGLTLIFFNNLDKWEILILAGFLGISKTAEMVVRQSIMPDIVPEKSIRNGLALERAGSDLTQIISPIAGGYLLSWSDMTMSYSVVVIFYLLSFILSFRIGQNPLNVTTTHADNKRPVISSLVESLKHVRIVPELAGLLVMAVIINLTAFPLYFSLAAVVVKQVFQTSSESLGIILGTYSLGAAIGSISLSSGLIRIRGGMLIICGSAIWHTSAALVSLAPSISVSLPIFLSAGIGQSMCVIMISTMILNLTPANLRGRIMGLRQLAVGGLPLGLLLSGAITELAGAQVALVFNGVIGLLLTIGVCLLWPEMFRSQSTKS
ncbi:MAG TPA: MFS transporter, partial [Dehalococcoidia bacterium]|nr:MFS transporter [Dehalococcoidia bacterium]